MGRGCFGPCGPESQAVTPLTFVQVSPIYSIKFLENGAPTPASTKQNYFHQRLCFPKNATNFAAYNTATTIINASAPSTTI
jgi:hypothetical protein